MTVRPPIYCCLPPVCPTWAPPEASLCLGCAACGSLRWDPGLYIEPLRTLRVQTFHSTSERLLPSMRNAALALITSHDQDHSVVSGWNWQAGFSLTLSKRARWEVLPAKTCVSTAVALRSFKENIQKKKLGLRHSWRTAGQKISCFTGIRLDLDLVKCFEGLLGGPFSVCLPQD